MKLLIPPLLLRLRVISPDSRGFRIWIPIFIFLPIVYFFLLIIACALAFAVLVYPARYKARRTWVALSEPFRMFHAFRGFTVDVRSKSSNVLIAIN